MDKKASDELEVALWATGLDLVELECLFKSAKGSKSQKNIINFVLRIAEAQLQIKEDNLFKIL